MGRSRFLSTVIVGFLFGFLVVSLAPAASAQMAGGAGFGGMQGMRTFSPVTGGGQMGGGMSSQQQMAQIYMLYGMLGGMGGGNVHRGPSNPFANGGFGPASNPYLDSPMPAGNSYSGGYGSPTSGSAAKKAALRAQRAEQKSQAKLAKVKVPKVKPASKSTHAKKAPAEQ
jgi:hypothetical protein